MPRDGSGIYTYPPGTPGIPDTTIESAKYNGFIADVQQDLNLPRPIVAGGTGATSAAGARDNLDAERSMQQVTNYSTHVFEAGSFYSDATPGIPGAPVDSHKFSGTALVVDANNIVLEARDESDSTVPGRVYVREKKGGVWSVWFVGGASRFSQYLSGSGTHTTLAGTTMMRIVQCGGGQGGYCGGATGALPGHGGNTTFGSISTGGSGVQTASGGDINIPGGQANYPSMTASPGQPGSKGASTPIGLGGAGIGFGNNGGPARGFGSGGGGGGSHGGAPEVAGIGGNSGAYAEKLIVGPAATYAYAVGAGGTAGVSASSFNGGAGAPGYIGVWEWS